MDSQQRARGAPKAATWKRVLGLIIAILAVLAALVFTIVQIDFHSYPLCDDEEAVAEELANATTFEQVECYDASSTVRTAVTVLMVLSLIGSIGFLIFSIIYLAKSRRGNMVLALGTISIILMLIGILVSRAAT